MRCSLHTLWTMYVSLSLSLHIQRTPPRTTLGMIPRDQHDTAHTRDLALSTADASRTVCWSRAKSSLVRLSANRALCGVTRPSHGRTGRGSRTARTTETHITSVDNLRLVVPQKGIVPIHGRVPATVHNHVSTNLPQPLGPFWTTRSRSCMSSRGSPHNTLW